MTHNNIFFQKSVQGMTTTTFDVSNRDSAFQWSETFAVTAKASNDIFIANTNSHNNNDTGSKAEKRWDTAIQEKIEQIHKYFYNKKII